MNNSSIIVSMQPIYAVTRYDPNVRGDIYSSLYR
jgi:hypothetical protein